MKKSIISLAVAAMALITPALISAADNGDTKTTACPRTECVANCNTNVKPQRPCPFDGLNLTDAQKKQIETLGCPAAKAKKDKKDLREQRRQQRADYLAQVKKILTTEQYVKFLENQYLNKPGMGQRHDKFARGGKHGKRRNA